MGIMFLVLQMETCWWKDRERGRVTYLVKMASDSGGIEDGGPGTGLMR